MKDNGYGKILNRLFPDTGVVAKKGGISKREKAIRVMLRRAGISKPPSLASIIHGKSGLMVPIKNIALFIGTPTEEPLLQLSKECIIPNRVNLSAEVQLKRVIEVGAEIFRSGKMYQPIQVARMGGTLECTSGRHRLAFLALVYGSDAEIPLYIEDMTLNEARDAVVVANQARPTKALERAEHAVLQAVGGNVDAAQDELYSKTITRKSVAKRYCVYSVISRGYPARLSFPVSQTSSRRDGGLTTITNVENFWAASLEWNEETLRKDFDKMLLKSVKFINRLIDILKSKSGFDPSQHLSSMSMTAIGKYYRTRMEVTGNDWTEDEIEVLASLLISLGEIGRWKSEKIYADIAKNMRGE